MVKKRLMYPLQELGHTRGFQLDMGINSLGFCMCVFYLSVQLLVSLVPIEVR